MDLKERFDNLRKGQETKKNEPKGPRMTPWRYIYEVIQEMKKVSWPKRQQVIKGTTQVLVVSAIFVAILGSLDLFFNHGLDYLLNKAGVETNNTTQTTNDLPININGQNLDLNDLPDNIPLPPGLENNQTE